MVPKVICMILACLFLRAEEGGSCAIPLQATKKGFVAKVMIGNGPYRFLFDTGTSRTVVTPELARRLDIEITGKSQALTTSGAVEVAEAVLRDVRVGLERRDALHALVLSLPNFPSHGRIDGILGADFLKGRGYLIDLGSRCITLDPVAGAGTAVEAEEIAGRVALKVDSMNMVLDSAASFLVLLSPRARALAQENGRFEMNTARGREIATSGVIERLRIGDVTIRGVVSAFARQQDLREDALIPITLFREVYVAADRRSVVVR